MDIQYFGANCVKISGKKGSVVVDDNLSSYGLKPIHKPSDILLYTKPQEENKKTEAKLMIDQPGEYEASDISIIGIAARPHTGEQDDSSAIMYKITIDDIRVAVVGHVHPDLKDTQLEALGVVDVLVVPVGGHGYTLDGVGAHELIKEIEPKLVIPTHYLDKAIKYEVEQTDLQTAVKALGMEIKETLPKLKVKPSDFSEGTELIVLQRQ